MSRKDGATLLREGVNFDRRGRAVTPAQMEQTAIMLFEAFNRRELAAALDLLHQDIVFEPVTAAVIRAGDPYRGHDGVKEYLSDIETHWEELVVEPIQVRAAGRAVVALGQVSGRARKGSLDAVPTKWILKFRDGLVVHVQIFADTRGLAEVMGLPD